jgi:hypothetical protein
MTPGRIFPAPTLALFLTACFAAASGCATRSSPAPSRAASTPEVRAMTAAEPGTVDAVTVGSDGAAVDTRASLAAGELYLLRASGTIDSDGTKVDAEYLDDRDVEAGIDVGLDTGMLQIHAATGRKPTPDGPGRVKWFGPPRADHTYFMIVTGAGKPLSLKLVGKPGASRRTGGITVTVFPLSPPPPPLGEPLEIVSVPLQNVTRSTTLITRASVVYLLQTSGAGKVGGGGLGLGDAEYMDWGADGQGRNEGEASADFGLGVDEARDAVKDVGHGARYEPRARWWGRFRTDHVYYMLFAGTGRPIALNYHDSGYGDNSKTDALTFKIFATP